MENSISSKDSNETSAMNSKSDNIEIMIGNKTDEIIVKRFDSFLQIYQKSLEELMKGREFVFDSVDLLHYKCHRINLNRGESYIDSLKWLKNKKITINTALNILYVPYNSEEIRHACISKHNSKRKNQIILLMITDNEKWHYLAVKKLSAPFCRITSKHDGDFYFLNCLHSFRTGNKLKEHENVSKNHDYCYIEMPKEENILNISMEKNL